MPSKSITWSSSVRSVRSPVENASTPPSPVEEEEVGDETTRGRVCGGQKLSKDDGVELECIQSCTDTTNKSTPTSFHESLGSIDAGGVFISPNKAQQAKYVSSSNEHKQQLRISDEPKKPYLSFNPQAFGDMNASLELDFLDDSSKLASYVASVAEEAERTAWEKIIKATTAKGITPCYCQEKRGKGGGKEAYCQGRLRPRSV